MQHDNDFKICEKLSYKDITKTVTSKEPERIRDSGDN